MMIEADRAEIVSGLRHGITLGSPITVVIRNRDWENWADTMHPFDPPKRDSESVVTPRPGHADLAGAMKFNHRDLRNVLERASARETAARVAVGSIARQLLEYFGVGLVSHVIRIGPVKLERKYDLSDLGQFREQVEKSKVRCIDKTASERMAAAIQTARKERDTLGGVVEVIARGLPVGLGGFSQWSDRLDGRIGAAVMSIPSVKGVEIGAGFKGATLPGSRMHDEIFYSPLSNPTKKDFYRKTNRAGGIEGGITNGEDVIVRMAIKPISTLGKPLGTVNLETKEPARAMVERSDTCVVPVIGVVAEAVLALVLADAFLDKFGGDSLSEIERNYRAFLDTPF